MSLIEVGTELDMTRLVFKENDLYLRPEAQLVPLVSPWMDLSASYFACKRYKRNVTISGKITHRVLLKSTFRFSPSGKGAFS